ncbi:MAG TPA: DUF6350 family protein [Actinomycetota bacterium]|nr:DUF6350 family protein [Actinomycetota bacterium]
MRCRSCSADVPDDSAFCPRCGASLAPEEGASTSTVELGDGSDTAKLQTPATDSAAPAPVAVVRTLTSRAWVDAAAAASMSWLALLCIAAVLLLAPKLQYPSFAKGADPVDIFTGMVMVSLGMLRAPIHIGGLTVVALPLGVLVAVALTIAWATTSVFESRRPEGSAMWRAAARVATVFALMAWLLSLVFRFRGDEPAWAGAWGALVWGFVWSFLFAALGLARRKESWRTSLTRAAASIQVRFHSLGEGITGGAIMLVTAAGAALAALLLWIITGLAREAPYGGFGVGDAAAAVLYLAAFLPNVIVALIAFSMGSTVYRGAQVGIGGRKIGGLEEISLLQWPSGIPWFAFLLLLIPVCACLLGGYWIGRRAAPGSLWRNLIAGALTFSVALALLGWLGEARVGAGLIAQRGFARVAISPFMTFLWGVLWAMICGWLGSELALRSSRNKKGVERIV